MTFLAYRPACVSLLVVGAACAPSGALRNAAPEPPSAGTALGEDNCTTPNGPVEPLVVDMKDQDRAKIELALGNGIAFFQYDCGTLTLLPECTLDEGDYNYVGFTKKERVLRLRSADELHANLPTFGAAWAAKLEGDFERGSSLDIALAAVGQRVTTLPVVSRTDLHGACEGATHFVKYAQVGAFAIETGTSASARTAVQIFDAGVEGSASSSKFERVMDGELPSCAKATTSDTAPPEGCGAILRLGLTPLVDTLDATAGADGEPVCPDGLIRFGTICTADTMMARCRGQELDACQALCEKGDVDGCYWRAALDFDNQESSLATLRRLCDQRDYAPACETAATGMYNIDRPSSLPYWKKACELGEGGRECRIWAENFLSVKGEQATVSDRREALDMLGRACVQGEALACIMAGNHYIEPDPTVRVVEPDEKHALSLFLEGCFGSPGECTAAAQLLEGQSWCAITSSPPALCSPAPTAKNVVNRDRDRALSLFRRACSRFNGACRHLFRFGEFDKAKLRAVEGAPEKTCASPASNPTARTLAVYQCALASLRARAEDRAADAKRYLQKACDEKDWITAQEAETCKAPKDDQAVWRCRDATVARESSAWACQRLTH